VKTDCHAYKNWLSKRPPGGDSERVHAVSNVNVMSEVCATLQSDNIAMCENKDLNTHHHPFVQRATIGGISFDLLRDTGADISLIRSTLVGDGDYTGSHVYVRPILSRKVSKLPLANGQGYYRVTFSEWIIEFCCR
jgi:hypothetical protein